MPSTPSRPSTPSQDSQDSDLSVPGLKRRLAALQQQIDEAASGGAKKPPTAVTTGRGIRRLISLFEPIDAIVAEADYRIQVENDGSQLPEPRTGEEIESKLVADRTYRGYALLLRLVPRLKTLLEDSSADIGDLDKLIALLQKGANDARSDDVRRIKEEVGDWLNADFSPTVPFGRKSRAGRGLQNDICGRLLCPIDHNWDDERVCLDIRAGLLDISDNYFLSCLYPKAQGNPNDVEKNFLRSGLLVKTFCALFTSPASSESFEAETDEGPSRKKHKTDSQKKATKADVATLLHMEGRVTARSIAYAATLLVLNLTDVSQWVDVYNGFSFQAFYCFIIDYFEDTPDLASKARADSLLKWWNGQVFPHHTAAVSNSHMSRNRLAAQRARHGHI